MQQNNNDNTAQLPERPVGIPLGAKVIGWKKVQPGEYVMQMGGSVYKWAYDESVSFSEGMVIAPDNAYNAIDITKHPLPYGWEYDGVAEKPETWYRRLRLDSSFNIWRGPDDKYVLGLDGKTTFKGYNGGIIDRESYIYRIFIRLIPPTNAYGVADLSSVPVPAGYERAGDCEAQWFRVVSFGDVYLSTKGHCTVWGGGDITKRIILRKITKRVLVGEWVIDKSYTNSGEAVGCNATLAEEAIRNGRNITGSAANFRIETRPA